MHIAKIGDKTKPFLVIRAYYLRFQIYNITKCCKKWGNFIRYSPFLVPKYFQRQNNTIPTSKIYPAKKGCKKRGGNQYRIIHHSEFRNISKDRKVQFLILFPTKHIAKKRGRFHKEFTIPTQESTFCRTKNFLQKMLDKNKGGVKLSYRKYFQK